MEDLTILGTVSLIVLSILFTIFRLTSNPRQKQKDTHYSQLIKIKDDTISASVSTIKQLRSKIYRMEQGPTLQDNGEESEVSEDDLLDLYDIAPKWVRQLMPKEDVRKLLKENPDKIQKAKEYFKNRKGNKEVDDLSTGL